MQQPAAVMDAVLFKRVLESQAKQFPCSLWMRDLSGGGGYVGKFHWDSEGKISKFQDPGPGNHPLRPRIRIPRVAL